MHFRFVEVGKASLVVAGTDVSSEVAAGNASDVAVPARWLQSFLQDAGLDYTYASFQGTVADPLQLNEWKAGMKKAGFQEVDPDSFKEREGNALEVNDRLFIETADRIQENIYVLASNAGLKLPPVLPAVAAQLPQGNRDCPVSGTARLSMRPALLFGKRPADAFGLCCHPACTAGGNQPGPGRYPCDGGHLFSLRFSQYYHCPGVPVQHERLRIVNKDRLRMEREEVPLWKCSRQRM